jgi:multidrug efflux pump
MGGMIAVVVLALLMVPVFFVVVMRVFGRDKSGLEPVGEPGMPGPPAPLHPAE